MQKVCLERPARELMLLCILLGKLQLAVLFWGYEKVSLIDRVKVFVTLTLKNGLIHKGLNA